MMKIFSIFRTLLFHLALLLGGALVMSASCSSSDGSDDVGASHYKARFSINASTELVVGGYASTCDVTLQAPAGTRYTLTLMQEEPAWCFTSLKNQTTEKSGTLAVGERIEKLYITENGATAPRVATLKILFNDTFEVLLYLSQGMFDRPALFDKPWAELPEYQEHPDRLVVTHYAEILKDKQVRNFTLCYDTELGYAVWCAYPLHSCYMAGGYNRTDDWQYDPKIPVEYQTNLSMGSYRGSWVRGHQVMSNHRYTTYSDELNAQTFYSTNIMPQHYGFNGGLWNDVEEACTRQACADTLYCVTGAYGSQGTTTDKAGKAITIPAYCFKAMVRTRSGKSGERIDRITDPALLKGIAYWAPNSEAGNTGKASDFTITIAELEELTGFTFFPMLHEEVREAVKSQNSPTDWNIK